MVADVAHGNEAVGATTGLIGLLNVVGSMIAPWAFGALLDTYGTAPGDSGYTARLTMLAGVRAGGCAGRRRLRLHAPPHRPGWSRQAGEGPPCARIARRIADPLAMPLIGRCRACRRADHQWEGDDVSDWTLVGKTALVVVHMQNAICKSPSPLDFMGHQRATAEDGIIPHIADLLAAFRSRDLPVLYVVAVHPEEPETPRVRRVLAGPPGAGGQPAGHARRGGRR